MDSIAIIGHCVDSNMYIAVDFLLYFNNFKYRVGLIHFLKENKLKGVADRQSLILDNERK